MSEVVSQLPAEMKVYRDLAASVPGWRRSDEAAALFASAYSLPAGAVIVEIGCFFGRSSILLGGARKLRGSGKIHCVDPFDCSGDDYSVPVYRELLAQNGGGSLRAHFDEAIRRADLTDWIAVHEGRAADVAVEWRVAIDLLLLDADYSLAGARQAYLSWARHLRFGGILVLDGSSPGEWAANHDGNRRVVIEEVTEPRYEDIRYVGGMTFARKRECRRLLHSN